MPINSNWARWIFASVSKHFDDNRSGVDMYIEGQHRNTRTKSNFFELRVDGPYYTEVSKKYWRLYSEINVLIQVAKDDNDYHILWKTIGTVSAIFTCIPVYKYGDGASDDDTYLGKLELLQEARGTKERVQVSNFGQIEPKTPILQATVEGHYQMYLEE